MSSQSRDPDRKSRFTSLYEATYADLLRFVQRRVPATYAEDVVAESFLAAWRRFADLPPRRDDARAWLFGIARGIILNAYRGAERQRALTVRLADIPTGRTADFDADLVARQMDVSRAWQRLSDVHQEALALAAFDGGHRSGHGQHQSRRTIGGRGLRRLGCDRRGVPEHQPR
jgi:RNA polymerase sigma-70 factor, ECF subfamily